MDIPPALTDHPPMSLLAVPVRRHAVSRVAWGLWALNLGFIAAGFSLAVVTHFVLFAGIGLTISLSAMATVAGLIITRRPSTRSGWLMLTCALSLAFAFTMIQLANYTWVHRGGDLGTTQALIGSAHVAFWFFVLGLVLLFLTFPDGRLPSPRWRPVVALLGLVCVAGTIGHTLRARKIVDPRAFMTDTRFSEQNGFEGAPPYERLWNVVLPILLVVLALTAASLVVRLRRARGIERQQLKWVVYSGVVALLLFPLGAITSTSEPVTSVLYLISMLALGVPAVGFGLALLRYRLWDIDLVASRSLVFALLWLAIAGVYVGIAAGLGLAAGSRLPVAVAIVVTVLATLVFQPARYALERLADRWLFGRRDSPLEAMHGFGELVGNAEQPGDVATQLAETASAAVGLAWVEVALDGSVPVHVGTTNEETATVFEISRGDEHFGELACRPHRGRRLTEDDAALLTALAAQAATAVSRAQLASRIVRAQEAERRRIERNIHDGAQQELVALVAQLGLARTQANGDGANERVLASAQQDVKQILANLRELAQGIHPSVLSDGGLVAAVEDRCSTMPIGVSLNVHPGIASQRFADDIEGAAYFFITEALTNVLKHSGSESVEVTVGVDRGELTAEVADSGIGFDPNAAGGSGLTGLADRIHAIGGELTVDSQPGAGTRLTATFPVVSTNATSS
jgi:signal transduction histidine kinase